MTHALIIDDNMIVSRAIQQRLAELGFRSFDHAWTERQAFEAAAQRRPDLVVVGDAIASGSPLAAAQQLCTRYDAPALLVTAASGKPKPQLPQGASLTGPFRLSELGAAVECAGAGNPRISSPRERPRRSLASG